MTLTVTFDLLQGQICCRAGDHNSLNLLVNFYIKIEALSMNDNSHAKIYVDTRFGLFDYVFGI